MKRYRLTDATPRPDDKGTYTATGVLAQHEALWCVGTLTFFTMMDWETGGDRERWWTYEEICGRILRGEPDGVMDAERVQMELDRLVELQLLEVDFLN